MNKKFFYAISVAAAIIGYCAYNAQSKTRLTGMLLANVEALTDGSESFDNKYSGYINTTDKNKYREFKTEIQTDTAGVKIFIQYQRTCTTYYTYCKHTGKTKHECHSSLNGLVSDCGSWSKN
ncbi:MAG: hypothetical protein NC080_03615 [Paraprevotella sp.]|nr:hypothetical protein [Paraprevotella sp.]